MQMHPGGSIRVHSALLGSSCFSSSPADQMQNPHADRMQSSPADQMLAPPFPSLTDQMLGSPADRMHQLPISEQEDCVHETNETKTRVGQNFIY